MLRDKDNTRSSQGNEDNIYAKGSTRNSMLLSIFFQLADITRYARDQFFGNEGSFIKGRD